MIDSIVAWCGPRSDGLGWLSDRCVAVGTLKVAETLSTDALDELCTQNPRRLILSVENRLWYPLDEVQYLQRAWPEIPLAVALGSWFDGSRRTGIGSTAQLCLPWYRWWDGWHPWLSGSNSGLLDAWPHAKFQHPGSCSTSPSFGHVVCNCLQTAAGWIASFKTQSADATVFTLGDYQAMLNETWSTDSAYPDWILWDDSCLNTAGTEGNAAQVGDLLSAARNKFPNAMVIAATCMPRWHDWQRWQDWGADELLGKPSQGFSLQQLLSSKCLRD